MSKPESRVLWAMKQLGNAVGSDWATRHEHDEWLSVIKNYIESLQIENDQLRQLEKTCPACGKEFIGLAEDKTCAACSPDEPQPAASNSLLSQAIDELEYCIKSIDPLADGGQCVLEEGDIHWLRAAFDVVRARIEPPADPVEIFKALQKRARVWAEIKIGEQTNFTNAHRLALVIGFEHGWNERGASPPPPAPPREPPHCESCECGAVQPPCAGCERMRKLFHLAAQEVIFFSTYDQATDTWPNVGEFYSPCVNLGDTFAYACADGERLDDSEIDRLIDAHKRWGYDGVVAWASLVRKCEPIRERRTSAYVEARSALTKSVSRRWCPTHGMHDAGPCPECRNA